MRVCERLVWFEWVGDLHLEEGGGGKDCGVMEGESGVREDVGVVPVMLRIKDRGEAWCSKVGCQMESCKVHAPSARSRRVDGRLLLEASSGAVGADKQGRLRDCYGRNE